MSMVMTGSAGVGARLAELWRHRILRAPVVNAAGASDVGAVRLNNEDYFVIADLARPAFAVRGSDAHGGVTAEQALLVVADGMGGAAGGEVGSAMAAEIVCSRITDAVRERRRRTGGQWRQALAEAFDVANRRIHERGEDDPALRGMGTTTTAAVIMGKRLYVAHVGDSRAYLVREGQARRLTRDHTWMQYVLDAGRAHTVEPDDPGRHALLRALGTEHDVTIDTMQAELRAGDAAILCTDGLWSVVDDDELGRLAAAHLDPAALCDALLELASGRGGQDNASVVVARIGPLARS